MGAESRRVRRFPIPGMVELGVGHVPQPRGPLTAGTAVERVIIVGERKKWAQTSFIPEALFPRRGRRPCPKKVNKCNIKLP